MTLNAMRSPRMGWNPQRNVACTKRTFIHHIAKASQSARYPFSPNDFHTVKLSDPPYGPIKTFLDNGVKTEVLVFQAESEPCTAMNTLVLEVFVSGDNAENLRRLVMNEQIAMRPSTSDLLHMVVEHNGQQDHRSSLLRGGIVEFRNSTYFGRLFFGNPDTQEILWDCDCRPSDACYLTLKAGAPFVVSKKVWQDCAVPLRVSKMYEHQLANSGRAVHLETLLQKSIDVDMALVPKEPLRDVFHVRPNDPEEIKLLKRELEVAVREEDYNMAAHIRDHPWMQKYRLVLSYRAAGNHGGAAKLESELQRMIQENRAD